MTNEPEPNTRPLPQPSELVARLADAQKSAAELAKEGSPFWRLTRAQDAQYNEVYSVARFSDLLGEAAARIAYLEARLEVVPGMSEDADGIACRNDTTKLQADRVERLEAQLAKLQADGDKLAGQHRPQPQSAS